MTPIDDVLDEIRAWAWQHDLRPGVLARLAGLHRNSLRDFNTVRWSPTAQTIRRLQAFIERAQKKPPA